MSADPETGEISVDLAPPVQVALARAAADVGAVAKDDVNKDQGFRYRGIERILSQAGPALHKHGVVALPRVVDVHRETMERGAQRNIWRLVALTVEYRFVGPAGDSLTALVMGEGLDNGDKAVSKAMTMAYKVALLQALQIADADSDPDAVTPPDQPAADTAPATPPLLSPNNVKAVRTKATEAGVTADQLAEVVMRATNDRTAVLEEVFANEVRALRDAMQAVTRPAAADVPPTFDALAPKVQERVDPKDTSKVPNPKKVRLIMALKQLGVESDEDQRAVLGRLLGHDVGSRSDLTSSEAASVLAVLDEEGAG